MPKLLVVDDEKGVCYSFRRLFASDTVEVLTAQTVAEGRTRLLADDPDVVVLDLQLPDGSGMDLFEEIRAVTPKRPVIFITAHGTTRTAIEAMKNGAFDYLIKPLDFDQLSALDWSGIPGSPADAGSRGAARTGASRVHCWPQHRYAGDVQADRPGGAAGCQRPDRG